MKIGNWPVVNLDDQFYFACHQGLACFKQCCKQLQVILTPYDILRLKRNLKLSSEVFLEQYAEVSFSDDIGLPLVKLKRNTTGCVFLTDKGCQVYPDRPGVCRLYPLGRAFGEKRAVYFFIKEKECLGHQGKRLWTVRSWLKSQGMAEYDEYNQGFSELIFLKSRLRPHGLNVKEVKMFFMACYNLDAFREFIFKSSFLKRFDLPSKRVTKVKKKDEPLLQLAYDWLKFALFGQPTLRPKVA